MNRLLLLVSVFVLSLLIQAQTTKISYAYDAAGNRVKREILITSTKSAMAANPVFFTEELAERVIKIYPNPTKGHLVIEISGAEYAKTASLTLFNLQGQTIAKQKVTSNSTDIDISYRPNGVYILQINIEGTLSSWKIIKE